MPVTPAAAAAGSAARMASSVSSHPAAACVSYSRQADSSRSTPVGSPASSVSTTPPGTRRSPPAAARAAELAHSEWPSWARSAMRTPGATASSAWRVGFSLHSSSRQPRPRSQAPRGTGPAACRTRATASSSERQSNSRNSRRASAQLGKCTCASTSPGTTHAPARSTRRAPAGASAGSSRTAAIRSPSSTSAAASGRSGSSVRMLPPTRTVVSVRSAVMAPSRICLTFDFDALSVWFGYDRVTPAMLQRGEYGARVGVPRVLERLAALDLPATFFIPGHTIESFPAECEAILAAGHEVAHHSYAHVDPSLQTPDDERADMERALAALDRLGVRPSGYRSPSADVSAATLPLLEEHGFLYDSSLMADDFTPYRPRTGDSVGPEQPLQRGREAALWELPMSFELDDWPHFQFAFGPPYRAGLSAPSKVLEIWTAEFDWMHRHVDGGLLTVCMHPQVIGRGHRMAMLERFIEHCADAGVRFHRMRDVATELE